MYIRMLVEVLSQNLSNLSMNTTSTNISVYILRLSGLFPQLESELVSVVRLLSLHSLSSPKCGNKPELVRL